jgi:DNA-binding NarL/FixJ family response regulator
MLTVLDYLEIRKAHAAGESLNSIAFRLGHCQKTVSKVIASQTGQPDG